MESLEEKILSLKSELDYENSVIPLYAQLGKLIKLVIRTGEYESGAKLPSERVMSEYFSMARGTLRKTIDELLEQNIVEKKHGKGIFVSENYAPRNIKMNVAIVYINNQFSEYHPMNADHILGVKSVLDKYGYKIELIGVDIDLNVPKFKKELKEKNINAVISFLSEETANRNIEKVIENMPFVSKMKYSRVAFIDFEKIMNMQFEYLYKMGHRNISFAYYDDVCEYTVLMLNSYEYLCKKYNLPTYKFKIKGFNFEAGEIIKNIIENKKITSVIVGDDFVACGMIRELYNMGLSCPKDISIIGMGDYEFAKWMCPALTTIKMPYYEEGVQMGKSIINKRLNNKLEPYLIERETVKKI